MSNEAIVNVISCSILPSYPIILCFCTGASLPESCIPMSREPTPKTGHPFNEHFTKIFDDALNTNSTIHDGAIVFLRPSCSDEYVLAQWSCRIASFQTPTAAEPNRGSAYNSAASMALETDVDEVFLITPGLVERFTQDGIRKLENSI